MRTKNALKNVIVSLGAYCLLILLSMFLRRFILGNFDLELVAYDGLLSNIFSFISIADMGAVGLFNYRIYKAYADHDQVRINHIMSMFRTTYRFIGLLMSVICGVVFLLLPFLFGDRVQLWGLFRFMYIIYAVMALSSYFFGYWQTLLVAGQKEYLATSTQTAAQIAVQLAKAVILLTTGSYLLYVLLNGVSNVASYLLIRRRAKKEYPEVKLTSVSLREIREEGMLPELRDLFVSKIASVILYSTDSLLITFLISTKTTALYGNYSLIAGYVMRFFGQLIWPLRATLADMVNKEDKESSYALYRMVDLFWFFFSAIVFVCYAVVFQPAITVLFGERFLLPDSFVLAYALQYYVNMKSQTVSQLRGAFGEYHVERRYNTIGAILNLVVSIVLGRLWGLPGIVLGTIISMLALLHCYFIVVDKMFYHKNLAACWLREGGFFLLACGELVLTRYFTRAIPYTLWGMIACGVIGICVPTLINLLIFFRTPEFKNLLLHARVALNRKNSSDTPEAE